MNGQAEYEYVVVGSGTGGGTVAARLAEARHKVLVLEASGLLATLPIGYHSGPEERSVRGFGERSARQTSSLANAALPPTLPVVTGS
jgi:choline dehydrogenase